MEASPISNMKKPQPANKTIKGLESGDIAKLLNIVVRKPSDYYNKAIPMVFMDSGLRLSELANLKFNDVKLKEGTIRVLGKGNRERIVPIGTKTRKAS
jgi:integrase/recombinase XerC